jgi:hypothetical protein
LQFAAFATFIVTISKVRNERNRYSEVMKKDKRLFALGIFVLAMAACPCLAAPPCAANTEVRQLNYWLGDWNITMPGRTGGASSKVSLSLDKCLFTENWEDGQGHAGENVFAYSPDDKSWHGMFADNLGRAHIFVDGKVASGSAEFLGPARGPQGEAVLNRIKVVRLAPDKVEQTWDKSTDNGATWTTVFRGEYARRNP